MVGTVWRSIAAVCILSFVSAAGCDSEDKTPEGVRFPNSDITASDPAGIQLIEPIDVAVDRSGKVYVLDWISCDVTIIDGESVEVLPGMEICGFGERSLPTGIAVGPDGTIYLNSPCGVLVVKGPTTTELPESDKCEQDSYGNIYLGITVADNGDVYYRTYDPDCAVRRFDGTTTTVVAGGMCGVGGECGPAVGAAIGSGDLALGPDGTIFISDETSCTIRRIASGEIQTIAGTGECGLHSSDGPALETSLGYPGGIALASDGSLLLAVGPSIQRLKDGQLTTVAGGGDAQEGRALDVDLFASFGVATDERDSLFFVEFLDCTVKQLKDGEVKIVAGSPCDDQRIDLPLPSFEPPTPQVGPCSTGDIELVSAIDPAHVYEDGEQLGMQVEYDGPGCTTMTAGVHGYHERGSPRYEYYCDQCIQPGFNGSFFSEPIALSTESGTATLTFQPGPFPPTGLDSPPNLEGFRICSVYVTLNEGPPEGNEVTETFDFDCGRDESF